MENTIQNPMKTFQEKVAQYRDMEPYSAQWWAAMEDCIVFVPTEMRPALLMGVVQIGNAM